jgi:type I restriction enzyme M protein
VNALLFIEDEDLLTKPGIVKTMYDPACGTGGMRARRASP